MEENPKPKSVRLSFDELMNRIKWPLNRFFLFLLIAVIFAIVMGAASYGIYRMSDAASLDLSLPEHQKKLHEQNQNMPSQKVAIEPLGMVDEIFIQQVADAIKYYEASVGEAKPFAPDALLDENLINLSVSATTE